MKTSVVSKEYKAMHEKIIKLTESWKNSLQPDVVSLNIDRAAMKAGVPLLSFGAIDFQISLYLRWIYELEDMLKGENEELAENFEQLNEQLDEETALEWFENATISNIPYFDRFAKDRGLPEWMPKFLAETAVHPYLHLLAEVAQPEIEQAVPGCGCPVCGETIRLAQLEGEGQKRIHCPRCSAHWREKRISCGHCGNDDHKTIEYLTVEGETAAQIQVCGKCSGYTKVIDTRQYITKPSAAMLDLTTIHLDFVAQENGYTSGANLKTLN